MMHDHRQEFLRLLAQKNWYDCVCDYVLQGTLNQFYVVHMTIVTCYFLMVDSIELGHFRVHTSHSHIFLIVFSFRQSGINYVRMTEGVHIWFR
jgi:hypothetical protein